MIERREFIRLSAALAFSGAGKGAVADDPFAGRISRIAFLDDAASLAVVTGKVPAATARAILSNRCLFLGGGALNAGAAQPQQALALAASREAAAAYSSIEPASAKDKLQRDARILRELASRAGAGGGQLTASDVASLFDALNRRVLIGIHTYIPDENDVAGWMERLIRLHDSARIYFDQLAEAYLGARAARDAFYDADDPLVRAAASADYGPLNQAGVQAALTARPKSAYAAALLEAHRRLTRHSAG